MIASLLNVSDPSGDAVGAGELTVPKAAIFRELANFDILNLSIADQSTFAFEISMASLENPWELPLGFSLPIIEVYAAIDPVKRNNSRNELLPGSQMSIGKDDKWNYAVRITGNSIDVYTIEDGVLKVVSEDVNSNYQITNNRIYVETNIRLVGDISVYAMSGSYDPFSETGWRTVTTDDRAWMLTGPSEEPPVLDVVVDNYAMQQRSIQAGLLPEITAAARQTSWLWVVVAGLLTCLLALIARPRKVVENSVGVDSKGLLVDTVDVAEQEVVQQKADIVLNQIESLEASRAVAVSEPQFYQSVGEDVESPSGLELGAAKKHRPIQWTSWDESDLASEDTMIEFDRIATDESKARASQDLSLNVEILEFQTEEPTQANKTAQTSEPIRAKKDFQENLLPEVKDESLLSSKIPPEGFTNHDKKIELEEVQAEDVIDSLSEEDLS